jgi:hypothetical protein
VVLTDEDDASVSDSSIFGPELASDYEVQPLVAYTCDQPISATTPGTYTNCAPRVGGPLYDVADYVSLLGTIKDPGMTYVGILGGPPATTVATGPLTFQAEGITQPMALLPSCTAGQR